MRRNHISLIIFIIGLSVIAYPWITKPLVALEENRAIEGYEELVEDLTPEEEEELIKEYEYYNELFLKQEEDNEESLDQGLLGTIKIPSKQGDNEEFFNQRLLGTIKIPKLKATIPIYQGASVENLRKGVAHISGTSLPTGELGSHSVIAGHNRYRNKELFTNVHRLNVGDTFEIDSLGKSMEYVVVNSIIVEPYETEYLLPVEGKDKVTLLTCSYFGKKRLLIMGERK